jgi:quinol monooxygenase YgiN
MRTILTANENHCQHEGFRDVRGAPSSTTGGEEVEQQPSRNPRYRSTVLVVSRFRVPVEDGETFRADLAAAHELLASRPGYAGGHVGRNVDDPRLWVLTTTWDNVGAYRRALSSYDVKLGAVPVLSRALDEPSAYEVVEPDTVLNVESTRSH